MTPQETPKEIKEAAEKTYPTNTLSECFEILQFLDTKEERDIIIDVIQNAFIAGATHPETERYYKGKHDQEMLGFMNWIDAKNIPINMNNFPGFLSAYRYEQTTKNK